MNFKSKENKSPNSLNSTYNREVNKINKNLIRKLMLRREHRRYKLKYKARKTVPPANEILRAVGVLNQIFSVDPELAKNKNLSFEYGYQLCRQLDENINQGRKLTGFLHLYSKTTDPQIDFLSKLKN